MVHCWTRCFQPLRPDRLLLDAKHAQFLNREMLTHTSRTKQDKGNGSSKLGLLDLFPTTCWHVYRGLAVVAKLVPEWFCAVYHVAQLPVCLLCTCIRTVAQSKTANSGAVQDCK